MFNLAELPVTEIPEQIELTLSPDLARFLAHLFFTFLFHFLGASIAITCTLIGR